MRDRLIELLKDCHHAYDTEVVSAISQKRPFKGENSFYADFLLANGVVVLPGKLGDAVYMLVIKRHKNGELYASIKRSRLALHNIDYIVERFNKSVFTDIDEAKRAVVRFNEQNKKTDDSTVDHLQDRAVQLFGKRLKDLSPEELKEYNRVSQQESRRRKAEGAGNDR